MPSSRRTHDALRNRMLRVHFDRRGQEERVVRCNSGSRSDRDDSELSSGQRSRLVEYDRGDIAGVFEASAVAYEESISGAERG